MPSASPPNRTRRSAVTGRSTASSSRLISRFLPSVNVIVRWLSRLDRFRTMTSAAASCSCPAVMPAISRAAMSSVASPLTVTRYTRGIFEPGSVSQFPNCVSLVRINNPLVARSPPDWDHPLRQVGQQVVDGLAAFGIGSRGDVAAWFVQHDGERPGVTGPDRAVNGNGDALGDDTSGRIGESAAVDADAPLKNQRARFGAAGEPAFRQGALERNGALGTPKRLCEGGVIGSCQTAAPPRSPSPSAPASRPATRPSMPK